MDIREIEEKDIPAILELVGSTVSEAWWREEYTKKLDKMMRYYLKHKNKSAQQVVLDGEKIIGFALAGIVEEEELDKYYFIDHANPREPLSWVLLYQITVDADYRGNGIGSLLLTNIEQRARQMNVKGVYTGTRGDPRVFYEKNGFVLDKVYLRKPI